VERTIDPALLAHLLRLPNSARLGGLFRAEHIVSTRVGIDCAAGGRLAIVVGARKRRMRLFGLT
jgi:hypothetical protein